ncbi:MAG TPA: polymer-forming cytoskeletal protein [Pyrinomonadaceae bacterium]|nr:polymer-forming cytoskeletal protein [Pyrinomonadaceae bacterium]
MLRIGKNPKDSADNEVSPEKQDASAYTSPRTYSSYQPAAPEVKAPAEYAPASPKAMTESETLAREIKEGNLSGFVGSGTIVTGEANFKAMMRVDGHLSGRINSTSGTLIVGANGKVDANIEVAVAIVHGTVNGDIIATQRLELGRAAKLNGNIQTASLMIEPGALFEGSCKMIKMTTGKSKSNGRDDQPLDTTSMKSISADGSPESTEIANVSSVAS